MSEFAESLGRYWNKIFATPQSTFFWAYLLVQMIIAGVFYWLIVRPRQSHSLWQMLKYVFPATAYINRQFLNDCAIFLINFLVKLVMFSVLVVSSGFVATAVWKGLYFSLGDPGFEITGMFASLVLMITSLAALDLGLYISHWLQHKIGFLWEFHKIHHTATTLTPMTTFRRHPVDLVLDGNISGVLTGFVFGVSDYLSGGNLSPAMILGVNAINFMYLIFVSHLQHTHIAISFGWFDRLFISPLMHQVHHSRERKHIDRNMGVIFAIWDGIAGTRVLPQKGEILRFGLADKPNANYSSLMTIYFEPFRALWRRITRIDS